jgi:hypothetical protein
MRSFFGFLVALLFILLVLGVGFVLFTGFVAYSGMRPIVTNDNWLAAYAGPPNTSDPHDIEHLGGLFESALLWAMRICGGVLVVVAAGVGLGHVVARGRAESLLGCLVALLAGALMVTQHWGAAVAVAVVAVAIVALRFARPPAAPNRREE